MRVDIGKVLHVLAHEIRTPSGIAQGYLRMLIEGRLTDPADRQRALEQTQKAVARVSELTQESTRLANWLEDDHGVPTDIAAQTLVARVVEEATKDPAVNLRVETTPPNVRVSTLDASALVEALVSVVKATARELRNQACSLMVRSHENGMLDIMIGPADQITTLSAGPEAPDAGPLALERGGLGLSLVTAAVVLDAHGAIEWTANGSRTTVGIRLPLKERAHQ